MILNIILTFADNLALITAVTDLLRTKINLTLAECLTLIAQVTDYLKTNINLTLPIS